MHTMPNVQNMQNSLLLTERTSALWAVYGYFFLSGDKDQGGSTMRVMRRQIVFFFLSLRAQRVIYTFPRGKEKVNQEIPNHSHHTSMFFDQNGCI